MDKNYNFFMKSNLNHYIGQWVVICGQKVVSSGRDVKKVFNEAKEKCPKERLLLTRIPDKETMIF